MGQAAVIDPFSPHNTSVLYFETAPGQHNVTFNLAGNLNLGSYSMLGLRITQVFHPDSNPTGGEVDFVIRLHDATGAEAEASISDHDGELHFPLVASAPVVPQNSEPGVTPPNGQTKNAMRSYLVRLSAFEGIDLTAIQSIEIDLVMGRPVLRSSWTTLHSISSEREDKLRESPRYYLVGVPLALVFIIHARGVRCVLPALPRGWWRQVQTTTTRGRLLP